MKRLREYALLLLIAVATLAILVTVILLCNWRFIIVTVLTLSFFNTIFGIIWLNKQQKSLAMGGFKEKIDEDFAKKLVVERPTTTFADIAGSEEAIEEVREIVEFLKNPDRFEKMGAEIPRGVLLVGPPGTGKTLLAKAVAGTTNSHFIAVSGSELDELYVGVGASRMRTIFTVARANTPAIIFLDEADVALKKRASMSIDGATACANQTLGEFLNQLDGFKTDKKTQIVVLVATNRPDALDPAAIRPGRLDRKIIMGNPDAKVREAILGIHTRNKPLADDVKLSLIAKITTRFSGADLATVANEAAILAVRQNKECISQKLLIEAVAKVAMGPERKEALVSREDLKIIAYHEAGHTLVAKLIPGASVPIQATILGRGPSAGATWFTDEERKFESKTSLLARLAVNMGGRAGEMIKFGEETSGACGDFQNATVVAKRMVREYGMSERVGKRVFAATDEKFLGFGSQSTNDYSEETQKLIDDEEKGLLDEAYKQALQLLKNNRSVLDALAEALLKKETLNEEEINQIVNSVPV